jgi:integrase
MKLTARSPATVRLPAGKTDAIFFDDDVGGFGLRVRASGAHTWVFQYRAGKRQRRIVLGNALSVPFALARENAGKLEAKIRLGGDPLADKQVAKHESENTVGALIDQFLKVRRSEWRDHTYRENTRHLLVHAKPLHVLPVASISQQDIAKLLRAVTENSGRIAANRVRSTLAAFFAWVVGEGIRLPDGNPVSGTNRHEEKSRERVLTDTELKAVWNACADDDYGRIVRLLVLTGQRLGEIGALRWDEVRDGLIMLPSPRTKNHRPHTVPLSNPAGAILSGPSLAGRTFVFGRDDLNGFCGWSKSKRRLDMRSGVTGWTLHDLRRTCATRMIDLGVQPHIVEAVLNHVSGHRAGVAGVYNRATYSEEKRAALSLWAEHVMALVEGRDTKTPTKTTNL